MKKAETREEKQLFFMIGFYPLTVVFFGLLQLIALNAPLFCFGCTLMMLQFYIRNMQAKISLDSLTHLNNRGQISRHLNHVRYREIIRAWVAMIDIDRFKHINDTYGHAEGDRALILVADAMRQTAEEAKASVFLGRYGGDEFTLAVESGRDQESMEEVVSMLKRVVLEKQQESGLPFTVSLSIGYDMLKSAEDSMEACLVRADEKLYENKRRLGTGR